ncbi:hypothetical protein [Amphritea balenae]|uniref:Uncharacterized protein n=1 Tax=Amphritea balenae TaxID=452629 RepID=A0A3P1SWG6_9GAMM|nr:hypothetical protein [Amphritea balenae]RRD01529.1 hypothetical protein EHS89_02940 [Amphritea balenae]GGK56260.1 hypothetical protein GCM10007941_03050 [Amphritea balenae]
MARRPDKKPVQERLSQRRNDADFEITKPNRESELLKGKIDEARHNFHKVEAEVKNLNEEIEMLEAKGETEAAAKIRIRATHVTQELGKLQDAATEAPFLMDAFGLGLNQPRAIEANISEIIQPTAIKHNEIQRKFNKQLGSTVLPSQGPREPVKLVDGSLQDDPKVGKLRLNIGDETGQMAANASYSISVTLENSEETVQLKQGRTDTKGYSSVSLGHIALNDITEMQINVVSDDQLITRKYDRVLLGDLLLGHLPIFVPVPKSLIDKLKDRLKDHDGPLPAGTIEDPDEADLQASPESFGLNEEHVDGNCCLRPNSEFAAKEYHFRQIVRLTDIEDVKLVFDGEKEIDRKEVATAIPFGDDSVSSYAVLGGNVLVGLVNTYRHAWYPAGRGLGRLLYSTSLAPCEEINLAFIDWSRRERDSRRESRSQSEQVEHELQHDRSIDEVVDATLTEHQDGSSSSGGGGASLDLGIFSIGGGGGSTSSSTNGRRDLHSSTVQGISESISQNSSSIRHQRATVVTTSYQKESERIKTRTIHNHNMNHMMNLEYFQVVEHYSVKTELVEEKPVLLIPYEVDQDMFGTISSFDKYVLNPSVPVTRFLDRHRRILSRLVPRRYRRAFKGLSRLLHCRDIYQIETPYATFSSWEIKLSNAWRPGISLRLETHSGQSVKLYPVGGSSSSPPTYFRSSAVRDSDIRALTISFDSNAAVQSLNLPSFLESIVGDLLEDATKFKLERVDMSVTTDRSRFLSTPQTYIVETVGVNTTLGVDNPSVEVGLTTPEPDFSSYRGREHEDYCQLKELIAHIQSNPMRYMRAIWMSENPDRRAIRFDRYQLDDTSLLDHIINRPRGVLGNYVAFELLDGHRLVAINSPDYVVSNRVITLPTRGVFGEVFLSCCNATEKRDVERFIDPERSCQSNAPDITGVSPGSRAQQTNLSPTDFAAPIVNLQTAPSLPDPTGTANALSVLGTPDIFRDLSHGAELLQFIDNATKEAFTSTRQHRAAMNAIAGDVVRGLVSAYTGVPVGGSGSGGGQAAQSGTTGITSTPSGATGAGAQTSTGGQSEAGQILNGQMVRQTNPTQISDGIQTIQRAVGSGQLTQEQGNAAINQLVGGTTASSDFNGAAAPAMTLIQPTSGSGLAFNPTAGDKSNEITVEVVVSNQPVGGRVEWSCIDPTAVIFDTPDQPVTKVTGLKPGLRTVTCTMYDSSNVPVTVINVPLSIPQFVTVREDVTQFNNSLATLGLTAHKNTLLQVMKTVAERSLSTSNVRLIWEMAPHNESLPSVHSGAGLAFGHTTDLTIFDVVSAGTPGVTISGGSGVGPGAFNELIGVFPGALDDPSGTVQIDDAIRQIVAATSGPSPDAALMNLKCAMIARYTGVVLAHEVVHSLIGMIVNPDRTSTPHNTPPIPGCLMNTGDQPTTTEVSGLEITDLVNFPDPGTFTDRGVATLLIPSAHVQAQIDLSFPISI